MDNIIYASNEERYFSFYIEELVKHGIITYWKYQPRPFPLFDASEFKMKFKSGGKSTSTTLRDVSYTADFLITWNEKLRNILFCVPGTTDKKCPFIVNVMQGFLVSIIDTKGTFTGKHNNSAVTFPIKQKWVMKKHNIFVQKIIVSNNTTGIFSDTFTPHKFRVTDATDKARKLHYEPKTLLNYLHENGI